MIGITLWGQSAGGGSVSSYAYSWPEDPKVAGLIADSGSAVRFISNQDTAQSNFTALAGMVGCGDLSPDEELACMRNVDARDLENTFSWYVNNATGPRLAFSPVVDEKVVFSNYTERTLNGQIADLPMITGYNTNEGASFVPYTEDGPGEEVLFNTTLSRIGCSVAQNVLIRNLANLTTYRYEYAGDFSNISPLPWFGAYHSSELPMLFGTHYEYRGNSTEYQWEVANAMQALWVSFAENPARGPVRISPGAASLEPQGNPNDGPLFEWPLFEQESDNLLIMADGDTMFKLGSASESDSFCTFTL